MSKKNGNENKKPEEVVVTWGNRDLQKAILYSGVFNVASQLTNTWFTTVRPPESTDELVNTFVKIYEPLENWYSGGPLKNELRKMLDTLYPDPLGYDPGETLLEKTDPPTPDWSMY